MYIMVIMVKNKKGIYVASKIPENLKQTLDEAITARSYLNISDFLRDAIKEKLSREGFVMKLAARDGIN